MLLLRPMKWERAKKIVYSFNQSMIVVIIDLYAYFPVPRGIYDRNNASTHIQWGGMSLEP